MLNKNRKAQAAMEFLMTYGWAILVVLAVISTLAYFGVLKPQSFLQGQCILIPGVACLDSKITSSEVNVIIINSMGKDMKILSMSAGNCTQSFNYSLDNGYQSLFTITGCDNGNIGDIYEEDIMIIYKSRISNFTKTIVGSISGTVE